MTGGNAHAQRRTSESDLSKEIITVNGRANWSRSHYTLSVSFYGVDSAEDYGNYRFRIGISESMPRLGATLGRGGTCVASSQGRFRKPPTNQRTPSRAIPPSARVPGASAVSM
ncbi:hypothetical protein GCM10027456_34930 [Kineosporia babensis]